MPVTLEELNDVLSLSEEHPDDLELAEAAVTIGEAYQKELQSRRSATRVMFTDREKHGLPDESRQRLAQVFSDDENLKYRSFNDRFFREFVGVSQEQINALGATLRQRYSVKAWGEEITDEKAFYERQADEFDFEDSVASRAIDAVLKGDTEFSGLAAMEFEDLDNPLYKGHEDRRREQFAKIYSQTRDAIAGLDVDGFLLGMQRHMGVVDDGEEVEGEDELLQRVMDIPAEKRDAFFAAVAARAGEGESKTLFQAMGERLGRRVGDMLDGAGMAKRLRELSQLEKNVVAFGADAAISEEPLGFDLTRYNRAGLVSGQARTEAATTNVPRPGTKEFLALPEETQTALNRIAEERDFTLLYKRVNEFATGVVDPAKGSNWFARGALGIASSAPDMALIALGPAGIAASVGAYAETSYVETVEQNPGIDSGTADAVALATGVGQGLLNVVPFKVLTGKIPTLNKWINATTGTASGAVARGAVRTAAGGAAEAGVEFAQDVAWPSLVSGIASSLGADLGPQYEERFNAFFSDESMAELIPTMVMMSAIGAGVGGVRDFKDARAIMSSYEELVAHGLSEAAASDVRAAMVAGDVATAESLVRAEFSRTGRDAMPIREARVEAINTVIENRAKVRELVNKAGELDLLPAIRNEGDGRYSLQLNDGSSVAFDSYEAADSRRWQVATDQRLSLHQDSISTIRRVDSEMERGRETKYIFSLDDPTLRDQVDSGAVTEEQSAERLQIADETTSDPTPEKVEQVQREFDEATTGAGLAGATAEDRAATARILGSSVNEFSDGIVRTTVRLYQGATPLTIIEEKTEGDAKFMIEQLGLRKWMVSSLRDWEAVSGDKIFRAVDDDALSNQDIIEAWSGLTQAYFVGRSKKGDQGPVFESSRENIAKMMRTPLGASLTAYAGLFRAVWRRAAMIEKARRDGTLDKSLEDFLAQSTGMSEQRQFERAVSREGAEIADQISGDLRSDAVSSESVSDNETTFSLLPDASNLDAEFAGYFSPFQRTPELRMKLGQEMKRRLANQSNKMRPVLAAAKRTKKSVREERRRRQDEIFTEKLESIDSTEWAALEAANIDDAGTHPILSDLLRRKTYTRKDGKQVSYWAGSLLSKSAAEKQGMSTRGGEWDGIPDLPPYVWGGSTTPDQAADQFGFESVDEFWTALQQEIETWQSVKAQGAEVNRKIADMKREAREEATAWEEKALAEKESTGSDRAVLLAFLRSLEAITRALPAEVRGKIGGSVALAKLKGPDAMMDEMERRIGKIDTELERWLKKEADKGVKKLFERAKPAKDESGKKRVGKAGADIHDLFETARTAWKNWDAEKAEAHAVGIEAEVAKGELSPEWEAHKLLEAELVRSFGGWNQADSVRKNHALDTATEIWDRGYLEYREKKAKEKERRDGIRSALRADTGKAGKKSERALTEMAGVKLPGRARDFFLSLLNFEQLTQWAFGKESKWAQWFADEQRKAENAKLDAVQAVTEGVEDFFTELAGGNRFKGEQLQYRMMQRSMTATAADGDIVPLSELEALSALLMWQQEDGKRHLRGKRDENGKIVSEWAYDEDFIDEISSKLSPEAWRVLGYLQAEYGKEYGPLNAVYRDIYGINLPQNANYSPIGVDPIQAAGGQTVDPVTGSTVSAASFTPGSLRSRSISAIAEPKFENALATFLAHKKQIEHWKAHARFVLDANAVLGNRDVGNSVEAAHGKEAVKIIRKWLDAIAQGGVRSAAAGIRSMDTLGRITGNAASMALVGRIGTLAIQSTQLAAGAALMPTGAYVVRLGKLLSGNLGWGTALSSPYIQRRIAQQPIVVQAAMEGLRAGKPTQIKYQVRKLGSLLNGADALFTAGTYAIAYDYHFTEARKGGMDEAGAASYATETAERVLESVAQPTRLGTRSFFEVASANPITRLAWAFSSDARKNAALLGHAYSKGDAVDKYRATMFVILLSGLVSSVIRTAWRDARDGEDDEVFDEKYWSAKRLALSTATDWLTGFPVLGEEVQRAVMAAAGEYAPDGGLISAGKDAVGPIKRTPENVELFFSGDWEQPLRDVEKILSAVGLLSDNTAAATSIMHLVRDIYGLGENFIGD